MNRFILSPDFEYYEQLFYCKKHGAILGATMFCYYKMSKYSFSLN